MVWNEQDHPRKDDGKFTFKNGGSTNKTSKEILFEKSNKEKEIQATKQKRKNELLDILKDKATPADILYADNEKLEKKIEEYGLKGKLTGGASEITKNSMSNPKTIEKARKFIHGKEGFRENAYKDQAGIWTIGYGHTGLVDGKTINANTKISKEKAEELYINDFKNHIKPLANIKTPLSENQKVALSSLIYNVGAKEFEDSKMYKKIQAGDLKGAANEFDDWNKVTINGKKTYSKGLANRRAKEKELFLTPDRE